MTVSGRRRAVRNTARIDCSPEKAFDYLTDLHREPEWNEALQSVEPLTPGPLAAGSRFRVRFRGVGESEIEYLRFERPRVWATRATGRRLGVRLLGDVRPEPGGCEVVIETELHPHGVWRPLRPVLMLLMRKSWDRHLRAIKGILED